jgi:hypothetical protein
MHWAYGSAGESAGEACEGLPVIILTRNPAESVCSMPLARETTVQKS